MSGRVLCHPPIAVDHWKLCDSAHVRFFFLSHMHSDHTEGLTPSWSQPIYCSPVTRILLLDQFKLNSQQVRALALNESHCLPFAEGGSESLSVTLIDAHHCPGAVMFLFEGYFGRILYTGDFRYSQSMNCEESFARVCSSDVDTLYLDNTFCSPRCDFPPRETAMAEMLQIISEHPGHRVVIGLRKLGKEVLLVAVAKHLRTKICVTEERLHRLELLEVPNVFTTVESETRITVVEHREINWRKLDFWNAEVPTIAIIPTALYRALPVSYELNRGDVFVVPYSDHSSFTELREFVSTVGPRAVIPILTDVKDRLGRAIPERADMSCFAEYLDKSPATRFCSPNDFLMFPKDSFFKTGTANRARKNGQMRGALIKSFKFNKKSLVHHKGVVYENDYGDEESEKFVPCGVGDLAAENTDAWMVEGKVENCDNVKTVDENGFADLAGTADVRRVKNAHARFEQKVYLKSTENVDSFSCLKTGCELALRTGSELALKTDSELALETGSELALETGSELALKTDSELALPLVPSTECEGVVKCRDRGSQELLGKEAKRNADTFSFCKTGSGLTLPSLPSTEGEGVLSDGEHSSQKLLGVDRSVGSCSVAESLTLARLPSAESALQWSQVEGTLFKTPCFEGEGNVTLRVTREGLTLSDLILQGLQPIFAEEAQNMFQEFLRTKHKN